MHDEYHEVLQKLRELHEQGDRHMVKIRMYLVSRIKEHVKTNDMRKLDGLMWAYDSFRSNHHILVSFWGL